MLEFVFSLEIPPNFRKGDKGIKFVAKDGRNGSDGSDANVTFNNIMKSLQKAAATETSFITADEMGAPNIYGGKIYGAEMYANQFNVHPLNASDRSGGFNIYGSYGGVQARRFGINYFDGDAPYINIDANGIVNWRADTSFYGSSLRFGGANIDWGNNAPVAKFG